MRLESIFATISDAISSPTTLLWALAVLIAATLLFGAINRRRDRLTSSLKEFVDKNQPTADPFSGGKSTAGRPDANGDPQ